MRVLARLLLTTAPILSVVAAQTASPADLELRPLGQYSEEAEIKVQLPPVPPNTPPQTIFIKGCRKSVSEVGAYDPRTRRLFVNNFATRIDADGSVGTTLENAIDIFSMARPERAPKLLKRVRLADTALGDPYLSPTSVAVHFPLLAVAAEVTDDVPAPRAFTDPGKLLLFDLDGNLLRSFDLSRKAPGDRPQRGFHPGSGPDMVTFTPDGRHLLVAIEGEPDKLPPGPAKIDPEGSVAILDLSHGLADAVLRLADFSRFDAGKLVQRGVRIGADLTDAEPNPLQKRLNSAAKDMEPEFIAVSRDSHRAYVSLQENNAVAVVDVDAARVIDILPLGLKDHSAPGAGLDPSRRDGPDGDAIESIAPQPLRGAYQPDGIATFEAGGRRYFLTANEGDARNGDFDIAELADLVTGKDSNGSAFDAIPLDPAAFPDAADLVLPARLGELEISDLPQDLDPRGRHDGKAHQLVSLGGRSFSIWSAAGGPPVYDSGDFFEWTTGVATPDLFNTQDDDNVFDRRSPKRGPEPEGAAVGKIGGRTYAFVGLERHSGIMAFDVTNPRQPVFQDYANTRDFSVNPTDGLKAGDHTYDLTRTLVNCAAGDLGPEGILFIPAHLSPNRRPLLVVNYETSGSTRIFEIVPATSGHR